MNHQAILEVLCSKDGPQLIALEKKIAKAQHTFINEHNNDLKGYLWNSICELKEERDQLINEHNKLYA